MGAWIAVKLRARMGEQTSHLAIALLIGLIGYSTDLYLDGLPHMPHIAAYLSGCVVLFLFPEAPAWAKLIGLPLPPQVAALLAQSTQPSGLDVRASAMQPQENPYA